MLTVLNLAFEYGCDMELIDRNPCEHLRRVPEDGKKVEAFTKEEQRELERVIAAEEDPRHVGILLCLYTGLRIGGLLGLTWEDVDLARGIIHIDKTVYRERDESGQWQMCVDTPKTRSSTRVIPLPPYITKMLKSAKTGAKSAYVVENKKGERMAIRSYQYIFEKLTERAQTNPALQRLLDETDVLVDGPFILAQRSLELDFCGSKNQRLIDMNATRREGRIVLWTRPEW